MKYLFPWEYRNSSISFVRKDMEGTVFAEVYQDFETKDWYSISFVGLKGTYPWDGYSSPEELKSILDNYLVLNNFFLIKENEINRFKEKLILLL